MQYVYCNLRHAHTHTHTHTRFNGHFFPGEPGLAGCPLLLHLLLDCASFWDRPKLSMSFLTQSHQVFFPVYAHTVWPRATKFGMLTHMGKLRFIFLHACTRTGSSHQILKTRCEKNYSVDHAHCPGKNVW